MFRRHRERADEQEAGRLSWTVRRGDRDLVVSLVGPQSGVGVFERVDPPILAGLADASSQRLVAAVEALTPARGPEDVVATVGYAAPRPDLPPMTFVMSVALADVPLPAPPEGPSVTVATVKAASGGAARIMSVVEDDLGLDQRVPQVTVTFLSETQYGVLAVAFATPFIDGAEAFAQLFDAIGRSCTVSEAQPASAT